MGSSTSSYNRAQVDRWLDEQATFGTILMDPPWPERGGGKVTRGAQRHYPLVSLSEMPRVIRSSPLWRPRASGCLLWCWTTTSFLEDTFALVRRLGFTPCTGFVWCKVDELEDGAFRPAKRMGLGQRSRQEHEHLLVARMGSVPVPPPSSRPRSVIYAPRGRHSEKPASVYDVIEATSPGPYAELFARATRPGWSSWGNELPAELDAPAFDARGPLLNDGELARGATDDAATE